MPLCPLPLERFQPIRLLGKGGMAETWLAKDLGYPDEIVVVKVAQGTFQTLLHKEFQILCSLRHPYLIQPFYQFSSQSLSFLVLEYVPGQSLAQIHPPLPEEQILSLLFQILEALSYLHSQGIVHGDLKPSNVLLETTNHSPRIKLIDFGLASPFQKRGKLPGASPHYTAPERLLQGTALPQTDLYSLGCLLYYLLSGHAPPKLTPPFTHTSPKDPRLLVPSASPFLSELSQWLRQFDPAARPESAKFLLQKIREKFPFLSSPVPPNFHNSPFLERDSDLEKASSLLLTSSLPLAILGPKGVGKSRFLKELALCMSEKGYTPYFLTSSSPPPFRKKTLLLWDGNFRSPPSSLPSSPLVASFSTSLPPKGWNYVFLSPLSRSSFLQWLSHFFPFMEKETAEKAAAHLFPCLGGIPARWSQYFQRHKNFFSKRSFLSFPLPASPFQDFFSRFPFLAKLALTGEEGEKLKKELSSEQLELLCQEGILLSHKDHFFLAQYPFPCPALPKTFQTKLSRSKKVFCQLNGSLPWRLYQQKGRSRQREAWLAFSHTTFLGEKHWQISKELGWETTPFEEKIQKISSLLKLPLWKKKQKKLWKSLLQTVAHLHLFSEELTPEEEAEQYLALESKEKCLPSLELSQMYLYWAELFMPLWSGFSRNLLRRAFLLSPTSPRIHWIVQLQIAKSHLWEGDIESARLALLQLHLPRPFALYAVEHTFQGDLYLLEGEFLKALEHYEQARQVWQHHFGAEPLLLQWKRLWTLFRTQGDQQVFSLAPSLEDSPPSFSSHPAWKTWESFLLLDWWEWKLPWLFPKKAAFPSFPPSPWRQSLLRKERGIQSYRREYQKLCGSLPSLSHWLSLPPTVSHLKKLASLTLLLLSRHFPDGLLLASLLEQRLEEFQKTHSPSEWQKLLSHLPLRDILNLLQSHHIHHSHP